MSLFREEAPSTRADSSLLSSLSFWLLNDTQSGTTKPSTPSEIKTRKTAAKCVKVTINCTHPHLTTTFPKGIVSYYMTHCLARFQTMIGRWGLHNELACETLISVYMISISRNATQSSCFQRVNSSDLSHSLSS